MRTRKPVKASIKQLRNDLGLTQEQLAQKIGVTSITVSRWERGTSRPHPIFEKQMAALRSVFPGN